MVKKAKWILMGKHSIFQNNKVMDMWEKSYTCEEGGAHLRISF